MSPASFQTAPPRDIKLKWMEVDSNHRSNMQQIYSLSPLATRESIQIVTSMKLEIIIVLANIDDCITTLSCCQADRGTRTLNLLITNQLLCQLSHIGILEVKLLSDPNGNRTRVTAVKGRCLNRLTMGPY